MKKQTAFCMVTIAAIMVGGCAGPAEPVSSAKSETTVYSSAIPENLPGPVSGTLNGQTITMEYSGFSEIPWPNDNMRPLGFNNGYATVYIWKEDKLYTNYMDKTGKLLNNHLYTEQSAQFFGDDGRVLVQQQDETWVYLDKTGNVAAQYDGPFEGVGSNPPYRETGFGKWFSGTTEFDCLKTDGKFDMVFPPYKGICPVVTDNKLGLADENLDVIIEPVFPCVYDEQHWLYLYEDLIILETNDKTGILQISRS